MILAEDFRLFCGDLGNDVTDEVLTRVFGRYPSFQKARVIRDKRTNKTKGYGFVSFKDPNDFVRAVKELDGMCVDATITLFLSMIIYYLPNRRSLMHVGVICKS